MRLQRLLSELDIVHDNYKECLIYSEDQRKRIEALEDENESLRKQLRLKEG